MNISADEKPLRKKTRVLALTNAQVRDIYTHSGKNHRLMYSVFLNTGLRLNEFLSLMIDDIDFTNDIIYVNQEDSATKAHKRFIPLNREATHALKLLIHTASDSGKICDMSEDGLKVYAHRLSLRLPFKFSIHSLRHTFITRFYANCKDAYATARVAGHRNIQTTMTYVHVSDPIIRQAAMAIDYTVSQVYRNKIRS